MDPDRSSSSPLSQPPAFAPPSVGLEGFPARPPDPPEPNVAEAIFAGMRILLGFIGLVVLAFGVWMTLSAFVLARRAIEEPERVGRWLDAWERAVEGPARAARETVDRELAARGFPVASDRGSTTTRTSVPAPSVPDPYRSEGYLLADRLLALFENGSGSLPANRLVGLLGLLAFFGILVRLALGVLPAAASMILGAAGLPRAAERAAGRRGREAP